ncbi:putative cobalt-precorrin-5B C -methyltransferase [Rosellinia necatrix]|uniref:Putative cobalt-precorrin-5B C-methyltransferase n=1 Tax=Rosellinia necatrix TaxID=77044 RepID=A0A1W2TLZ9_ROSNE|nr:putative cobalt-precorrin-5B C -methyltransferase [Rosellinia necatrix]
MSHAPSTPAKIPASAATYTAATQDADLRSQLNVLLLREGHTNKIQERFLHSLDAHPSNWPSAIQSHALALLRSGEVSTFPALIRRVLEDVQRDTAAALASSTASSDNPAAASNTQTATATTATSTAANEPGATTKDGVNGAAVNGAGRTAGGSVNGASTGVDGAVNLAVPTAVVETALKVVRESLESLCEVEPDESGGG